MSVKPAPRLPAEIAEEMLTPRRALAVPRFALPKTPGREERFAHDSVLGTRFGEGETVLLVHGWEGDRSDMFPFVDPLVEGGFSALAIDLPAHGASPGDSVSIPELGASLAEVALEIGPLAAAIAHSVGTAATTSALARGLAVRRLVFVAPPANYGAYVQAMLNALDVASPERAAVVAEIERRIGVPPSAVDSPTALAACRIPGLILHSADDRVVDVANARAIAKAWTAASLVEMSGLGHRRILADPAAVALAVDFVAGKRAA